MEILKKYKTNFDYESVLFFGDKGVSLKTNRELEYIFFFIQQEESILINNVNYDDDYLKRIEIIGAQIPEFSKARENYINWWGSLKRPELERELNSKLTSLEVFERLGLNVPDSRLISDESELKEGDFVRSPFDMSSRKTFIYKGEIPKGVEYPLVAARCVERLVDLGVTYDLNKDNYFVVQNFNTVKGSFRGATYLEDLSSFDYISEEDFNIKIKLIADAYRQLGAEGSIQIDCFYFKGDSGVEFAASEVNYRRTMGLLAKSLFDLSNGRLRSFSLNSPKERSERGIVISPASSFFECRAF